MLSAAIQDYLKVIYKVHREAGKVTTSALAERLSVSSASVTNMIKKLAEMRLVKHTPYKQVVLTPAGEKIALEILRHHRLLELYLAEVMGYSWDQVHDEAEKLEHVISEEFEERMSAALGHPSVDPHGHPIPSTDGKITTTDHGRLSDLPSGSHAVVRRVDDRDADCLRYLEQRGLVLNARVEVIRREPFNGPVVVKVGSDEHHLGLEVARRVFVEKTAPGAGEPVSAS
ncbi:MAG: metal-dependent transcriptional regulator [Acidobacteria bacterium]|nr:metal-dependent transcriptional regulator [Acidobacteriota bacterium]